MKKYITEFVGTFGLVLAILMSVMTLGGQSSMIPIAIGAVLVAVIYAGGHISKAHYNPAITLAFWINRRIDQRDVLPYLVAQLSATIIAYLLVTHIFELKAADTLQMDLTKVAAAEIIGTFFLAFVILNVAIATNTEGNQFYGLAIGLVVIGLIYMFGGISGAAFNPAVALALCLSHLTEWQSLPMYLISTVVGATIGGFVFKYLEN